MDAAPEGKDLAETEEILNKVTDRMLEQQNATGVCTHFNSG